ncbi:hypothetical protein VNO78_13852 [Psophocarpus tetragonolobus]|uniref:Uncharacterized protein n=1 Tax=Psophocarpus tetragonolobus TaxID=3891 RepID=A0AAN9SQK0_PSOTE
MHALFLCLAKLLIGTLAAEDEDNAPIRAFDENALETDNSLLWGDMIICLHSTTKKGIPTTWNWELNDWGGITYFKFQSKYIMKVKVEACDLSVMVNARLRVRLANGCYQDKTSGWVCKCLLMEVASPGGPLWRSRTEEIQGSLLLTELSRQKPSSKTDICL